MCFVNKKIKELALHNSPQELMVQFKQYEYTLKYFSFAGNEESFSDFKRTK